MSLPNPNRPSRSSRNKSNRMNKVLNWSIGIVVVAIICVGGYLLFAIFHSPADKASSSPQPKKPTTTTVDGSIGNATSSSKDKSASHSSDQSSSNGSNAKDSSSSDSGDTSTDTSNTNDVYHFVGGGPNGPWQPIGTVQKGPHTTDYNQGSVDWNERVKALLYATNINDGDYTLWRLENGGGPDKSRGIISTKEDPNKKYDVLLQWVKNKGWKPVSVTLDSGGN